MYNLIKKSISDLKKQRLRAIIFKSIAISFFSFATLFGVFLYVFLSHDFFENAILEKISNFFGSTVVLILSIILFPTLITSVMNFFAEDIATQIEKIHYPELENPRKIPFLESLISALKFFAKSLFLNIFLLIILFIPLIGIFAYYLINGYLISREYFETIALRRISIKQINQNFAKKRFKYICCGAFITFLMNLPIINILSPIIAISMIVHLSASSFAKQ